MLFNLKALTQISFRFIVDHQDVVKWMLSNNAARWEVSCEYLCLAGHDVLALSNSAGILVSVRRIDVQ